MEFEYLESQTLNHTRFMYDTIYFQAPGDDFDEIDSEIEDDEEDEDFDDLHEVQVDDDLNEPDSDSEYDITNPDPDDDHLPDDDLQ